MKISYNVIQIQKNININDAVQKLFKNTFAERHMTKGQTL